MSQNEIRIALNNAEVSLNMEGLYIEEQTKLLCEKLFAKEITMAEYIAIIKQKAGVTA